ncbi:MAG: hypothetical protein AUH32_04265 [Actinobacteria bacterium 13_1_40CM_66_12]|nr:MAG: hypothetical protein AUH32_04265 [Actinobacteria bacterium 13_1_40CM_66_12]
MNIQRRLEPFLPPLVVGLLIVIVLIGLIGTAIKNPQPHDIPVGLVGPAPAVQQISSSFATAAPGAFDFTTFASENDARAALDTRTVDGVLILGSASPHLIIAGAAGDGVTGVITAAFTNVFKAQGATLTVETVHPFASGDAHGLILFFVVVATLISTLASQAVLFATGRNLRIGAKLSLIFVYGALVGMTAMGMAAWIAGGYGDGFWAAAGLDALASIAIGAVVAGLVRLLGTPGIGLAALLMLLSLVSSGGPVGSQLLPDFYRALAPWTTAGQLYGALRDALFFDGAALATPIAVLGGWLVVGLLLTVIGELATRSRKAAVPA